MGTLERELLTCTKNDGIGQKLLECLQHYVPGLQAGEALRLEHGDPGPDVSLPLTLITAIILQSLWKEREAKTAVRSYRVRADLEQSINLLRTTRHSDTADKLKIMVNLLFY